MNSMHSNFIVTLACVLECARMSLRDSYGKAYVLPFGAAHSTPHVWASHYDFRGLTIGMYSIAPQVLWRVRQHWGSFWSLRLRKPPVYPAPLPGSLPCSFQCVQVSLCKQKCHRGNSTSKHTSDGNATHRHQRTCSRTFHGRFIHKILRL